MRSLRAACTVLSLTAALAPAGALAQAGCLGIELAGAPGATVFRDGFEAGDVLAWGLPVPPSFSTTATDDLGVAVEVESTPTGEHLLELRWFLPGGHAYQSVALPFADQVSPGDERLVPGYPFPVELMRKKPRPRPGPRRPPLPPLAVESALPVGGTAIVEGALWGEWRVEAYLDGADEPCTPPVAFRLEP